MKIRVYFNLHTNTFSVQEKKPNGWRVSRYAEFVCLRDAKFKVSQTGRERVIREGRKNVHAYVEGMLYNPEVMPNTEDLKRVRYNPLTMKYFTHRKTTIHTADYVEMRVENSHPFVFVMGENKAINHGNK